MPDWQTEVRRRLEGAGLEKAREREIAEEIVQHLEERHADLTARGASAREAEASVLGELDKGHVLADRLRRVVPPVRRDEPVVGAAGRGFFADVWQDLRYALRTLIKNRGFTLVTLLSLALGIGANTALFEILVALHLRSLPVAEPEQLVVVKIRNLQWPSGSPIARSGWHADLSYRLWERIRDSQQAFSGAVVWGERRFNTATTGEARWARALMVNGDYFRVLGVSPHLGRFFGAADDHRGCGDPGAVLTYGYWQREFAGDPRALGRTLSLDGRTVHVVGVMPPSFFGLEVGRAMDIALPLCMEPAAKLDGLADFWLSVVGRLGPGWSIDAASAHLESISKPIFEETVPPVWPENAEAYRHFRLAAYPASTGISFVRERYTAPLFFLMGLAGFVLLIACTNLANLLLARASSREKEIAVRLALGASRGRLVRQLMVESLLIAALGAAAGLVLAGFLSDALLRALDTQIELRTDWRVLAFSGALAGLTALLFGLVPALRASRSDMGLVLKAAAGRSSTAAGHRFGLRRILVAAQVAFSFVLLLSALLFVRSLRNVLTVDSGFREEGVLVVRLSPKGDVSDDQRMLLGQELRDRLRNVPGVDAVAQTTVVPMGDMSWDDPVWLDGTDHSQMVVCNFSHVSPGYFQVLDMHLFAGRDFTESDRMDGPKVAIVNEQFARKLASGANVIGRRLRVEEGESGGGQAYEIVGMVRNSKYQTLREDFTPIVFVPTGQDPRAIVVAGPTLVIRTGLPMASMTEEVKRVVASVAPGVTMTFDPLAAKIRATTLTERLMATLAGFFGALAAVLAAVGLYGVVSYSVAKRTREIGIRVALGADRRRVSIMVLRETGELLAVGLAVGVALGLVATRAAGTMLYGLAPHDPVTILMAAALMAVVALVASLLPAYRAASVDPIVALREE